MDPVLALFATLDPMLIPLGAIVTFMVIGLIRGWVVPRQVHTDRIADKDKYNEELAKERDDWKEAYNKENTAHRETQDQNKLLLKEGETTVRLLEEMRQAYARLNPEPPQRPQREIEGP